MGEEYTGESASTASAIDKLQRDALRTTNAAVSEGKSDIDRVKAVGAEYIEQVKAFANSAIENAQVWFLFFPQNGARKLTTIIVLDIPPRIHR